MIQDPSDHRHQIKIKYQRYLTLKQLFQQSTRRSLSQQFSGKYIRDCEKLVFVFHIEHHSKAWNLRKTYGDLYKFQSILIKKYKDIPQFPIKQNEQHNFTPKLLQSFAKLLQHFLHQITLFALKDIIVQNFFDIFPQKHGHGIIYAQIPLSKRSGGRYNQTSCLKSCYHYILPCSKSWRQRYFSVTDNGIFYSQRSKTYQIKDMLLYCYKFKMQFGFQKTGRQLGIILQSSTRRLKLQASKISNLILFVVAVNQALKQSPFNQEHKSLYQKYQSFAPIRKNCSNKFYADGKQYFEDLYNQLMNAKKYVYITGWMITPYFLLKRPNSLDAKKHRLDGILMQLANRKVKIYIVLYQQPKIAINNDSQHVQQYFQQIGNGNIKVMRHPNYILIPFLWSHHEKLILIDQRVAFMGGLDICYGRWDTPEHKLFNDFKEEWRGADYCNFRIKDIYKPRQFAKTNLQQNQPRMPWHDVAVQIRGNSVHDLARHFISYWNFVNTQIKIDDDRQLLNLAGVKQTTMTQSRIAQAKNFLKNFRKKKTNKIQPQIEVTFRESLKTQRNSVVVKQNEHEQQFYQKYFEQQLHKTKDFNYYKQKVLKYPRKFISLFHKQVNDQEWLLISNQQWQERGKQKHLILRSCSTWSGGLSQTQKSIQIAYIDLIRTSKQFIYIQNQFFISKQNQVIRQLGLRIIKAFKSKQIFRVMVFIPLLPGFQGDIRAPNSTVMRIQLLWQYKTIWRSQQSLFQMLFHAGMKSQEVQNYIKFFSLRQHGIINQIPTTQILYIHSKLMIVDDQRLIIGSANINDRSLNGQRDSQLGLLVENDGNQNNNNVSKQIKQFRIRLLMQHFNLSQIEVQNYVDQQTWLGLLFQAKKNTQLYRYVFGCYPDDIMKKFSDIEKIQKQTQSQRLKRYQQIQQHIKGHVVQLPLYFLQQEQLKIQVNQKQYILPDFFFT